MSFTGQSVITTAQEELLDPSQIYWGTPELLDYLSKGLNALAVVKPDAVAVLATYTLVPGSSTQTIPSDGFMFLDLVRNLAPTVSAIREVDRNHLDHADPNWPSATGTQVLHFTFDPRFPRIFEIYPGPANGAMTTQLRYAQNPTPVSDVNQAIPLDQIYQTPLVYYVLSMAFAKNTRRQDVSKSTGFMGLFSQYLGQKSQVQVQISPRTAVQNGGQ